uniref:Uncharacterized protein n=1 Tax=Glossina pallidipes TaxID=7398 RepID=A0A1A9ZSR5_GLOPL
MNVEHANLTVERDEQDREKFHKFHHHFDHELIDRRNVHLVGIAGRAQKLKMILPTASLIASKWEECFENFIKGRSRKQYSNFPETTTRDWQHELSIARRTQVNLNYLNYDDRIKQIMFTTARTVRIYTKRMEVHSTCPPIVNVHKHTLQTTATTFSNSSTINVLFEGLVLVKHVNEYFKPANTPAETAD